MKIHYDVTTNKVKGCVVFGTTPQPFLDLGDGVNFDFVNDMDEYEVQNGTVVHVGPSVEKIQIQQDTLIKELEVKIQLHIDDTARIYGFDNINSIGKYLGYVNDYQAVSESLGSWTASVWKYIENQLVLVNDGTRTLPTIEEALLEIPVYVPLP